MNILFYTPVNFRCRDVESLALWFKRDGNQVFFLSQCEAGEMHRELEARGIETYSRSRSEGISDQLSFLVKFCWKNKIDVLFSHLEPTNFISVLAQYLCKAKVIIFRHHISLGRVVGFDKSLSYKITYRLARNIISVSEAGKRYMIESEGVAERRIHHIDLGYDFNLYYPPSPELVKRIKLRNPAEVLLISIGRLDVYKRHDVSIRVTAKLRESGVDARLIILGKGDNEASLKELANELAIAPHISFEGFVNNTLDYLAAADFLLHPSVLESSCVVVKEAALVACPVVVCRNVGDFDEYLRHEVNAILVNADSFVDEAVNHLVAFCHDQEPFGKMASNLKETVLRRFSIENTFPVFKRLISEL